MLNFLLHLLRDDASRSARHLVDLNDRGPEQRGQGAEPDDHDEASLRLGGDAIDAAREGGGLPHTGRGSAFAGGNAFRCGGTWSSLVGAKWMQCRLGPDR